MKTIFRNLWITLQRFRLASGLNIVGLSVAFAAFILILMQVRYELAFDRFHPHADRLYMAQIKSEEGFLPLVPKGFGPTFGNTGAGIEAWTMLQLGFVDSYLTVERDGAEVGFVQPVLRASENFAALFRLPLVEGTVDALKDPSQALLPASLARSFFGSEHGVVGRKLTVDGVDYRVGAVYRDLPENSQIKNKLYLPLVFRPDEYLWDNFDYQMYLLLHPGADAETVAGEWAKVPADQIGIAEDITLDLVPLAACYYDRRPVLFGMEGMIERGKEATTEMLLAIALLVIGIAAVNFVNFSTSLTPLRIKNINTRKVLGSSVAGLRAEQMFESTGIALLSFGLGLLWVDGLRNTAFNDLISGGISLSVHSGVVWLSLGVAAVVGLLAGIYPALYSTAFPPALVLKGSFGLSPRGRRLRTALIGFQFVVSIGLIVAALFMQLQNRYMRRMDTGVDFEGVVMARLGGGLETQAFEDRVRQSPGIEEVAYSRMMIGVGDTHPQWGGTYQGEPILYAAHMVSWNFPRMMGIELTEGRYFTEGEARQAGRYHYIFNEAARREFDLTVGGQWLDGGDAEKNQIVGFARNFNYRSLHSAVGPMALVLFGHDKEFDAQHRLPVAYFKIKGDPYAAVEQIKRAAAEIDPAYPIDIRFYDQAFDALYRKERKTTTLITTFSLLAVVLSLAGVFGLVVFETQYRRKEIGVRKVMGATVSEILGMFNRQFVWLVGICFVVAAPLAWYGVREWLATFAYRTPLYWWVFLVSLVIVLFITLLTVTIQSWRAATANPVDALKAE